MVMFWIVVAMLLGGALLLLLPCLWRPGVEPAIDAREAALAVRRDQWHELEADVAAGRLDAAQLAQARADLDRRAREDAALHDATAGASPTRRTALLLALWLPAASIGLYVLLGNPQATTSAAATIARHSTQPEQVQQMVAALAGRLKAQPDDLDGWTMLGRSYVALGRYRDAATALQRASALAPGDASLLADLADVTAMAQGRKFAGEPTRLIQKSLDIDPKHVKALALAGSAAFDAQDYEGARSFWQRLLAVVPADSPLARSVQGSLAQAQQQAAGGAAAVATAANEPAAAATLGLSGQVTVSAELASRVGAGDTLFVFARAVQGPRMPLAIVKRTAASLPASFALDDSMAMSPALRLSGYSEVIIGARISQSGNATPQSGDLIGQSAPVRVGAKDLRIVIDRVQP
jgi:cytochrome c-type biogenesis protein CcmH